MRCYFLNFRVTLFFAMHLILSLSNCEAASNLAPALRYQYTELTNLASNYQTTCENLIQVDGEISLIDQTTAILNSYTNPCSQIMSQMKALNSLLVASSNKQPTDPTLVNDNMTFQSMLVGLNSILNIPMASSNLILLQTQAVTFTRSNITIQYPHYDVEWSSIMPMSFSTNTQAGELATLMTSFLVTMNATTLDISLNISNLTNSRSILVSMYNSYVDQRTQYFQTISSLSTLISLSKK